MLRIIIRTLIANLALMLVLSPQLVTADDWQQNEYGYFADNEPLSTVLTTFASSVGIPIVISPEITSNFSGRIAGVPAIEFLQNISTRYGLIWYFDGLTLFIYNSDEISTILVRLNHIHASSLEKELRNLEVWDEKFPWKITGAGKVILISGPPRYIDIITEVLPSIDVKPVIPDGLNNEYSARTFKLKYAKAGDQRIEHRGGERTVDGIATILQDLVSDFDDIDFGSRQALIESTTTSIATNNVREESNTGGGGFFGRPVQPARPAPPPPTSASKRRQKFKPYIQADERNNAIIVFDRTVRIPLYEKIIEQLDTPAAQIEIEVSIIDVSADKLTDIGVDWQSSESDGNGNTTNLSFGDISSPTNGLSASFIDGNGQNFTTVLQNGGNFFLSRIRALASEGEATVLSQPSVLTHNNLEAILDHSTSFFVRLEGVETTSLQQITVGSFLQVTPQLVDEPILGQQSVQLDVRIEDGRILEDQVDDIPQIINTTINTTATIGAEASLLVGGYYYDQQTNFVNRVPYLSNIPVLGHLFRSKTRENGKTARLFLITPKVSEQTQIVNKPQQIQSILDRADSIASSNTGQLNRIIDDNYTLQENSDNRKHSSTQPVNINGQQGLLKNSRFNIYE